MRAQADDTHEVMNAAFVVLLRCLTGLLVHYVKEENYGIVSLSLTQSIKYCILLQGTFEELVITLNTKDFKRRIKLCKYKNRKKKRIAI